ncbi:MAG: type II toxin-antitoxin system HipA family toxin [Paludibacteraceae bacterium]|nr:type II toxin-antitoxin system HipA family toxin [Paludibacteraceae bacterium]MBR0196215.1 type II toxin-antitoxin system HipA family toxin [Paludibacteraceae bacterium]
MKYIQINIEAKGFPKTEFVGTLGHDMIRGNATYQWEFDGQWLQKHRQTRLSGDLQNAGGPQYGTGRLFGFLQDAMPDRWGRRLIDKRERLLAAQEGRAPRHLTDIDYLTQINDTTRMGALRLKDGERLFGTEYADTPVPPLTHLREFVDMAQEYERQDEQGGSIREEWLLNIYKQGSSLGGARPKANVRDTDGSLWIAKIPSVNDDYDVALWEFWAHKMASQAGIDVPEMRLFSLPGQKYHTLLSKRFDRDVEQRIHFASAMTLCGLQDGADVTTGNGYLDIVDVIVGNAGFVDPQSALEQLYRRVAFSIAIRNHDDHFRNHGFLLTEQGWVWSPAYDLNPSDFSTQSLLISRDSNESSLDVLLAAAGDYMLTTDRAQQIINEVRTAMTHARPIAHQCGISGHEMTRFL